MFRAASIPETIHAAYALTQRIDRARLRHHRVEIEISACLNALRCNNDHRLIDLGAAAQTLLKLGHDAIAIERALPTDNQRFVDMIDCGEHLAGPTHCITDDRDTLATRVQEIARDGFRRPMRLARKGAMLRWLNH